MPGRAGLDDRRNDVAGLDSPSARILPGGMRESPCDAVGASAILSEPSAPGRSRGDLRQASDVAWQRAIRPRMGVERRFADPGFSDPDRGRRYLSTVTRTQVPSNEWTRSKSGEPPSVS